MKIRWNRSKPMGITLRTALLSWLVTLVTLLIFIAVIVPEQKNGFLQSMESKARGVAVGIRDLRSAVVNEDYTLVIDYLNDVLREDESIDHIVLADKDGPGLVLQRLELGGWYQTNSLAPDWRPSGSRSQPGIERVPLTGRRAYRYSQALSYSGIDWGWIHIGLSPRVYDTSVHVVYARTGVLAVFCVGFSFVASVVYAKRLVRPILDLRGVVLRLSGGDLSARAETQSGDELGSLAASFNRMADALLTRDRILENVQFAAQQFLGTTEWKTVIDSVLARLGKAAAVSRVYIFENHRAPNGEWLASQRHEWSADSIEPQIDNPVLQGFSWRSAGLESWASQLDVGEIISRSVSECLTQDERALMDSQGIRSLILVPIWDGDQWWGFLGMDDCLIERQWTVPERGSLRAAADMVGAAIVRQKSQDALELANETLEGRVTERTAELSRQVAAKEQARAELAETQQKMLDLSRRSGMAEVATGVLHNVGNVLNSVNVSANLLQDWMRESKCRSLAKVAALLRAHEADLPGFLAQDPKGRQLPAFLIKLSDHLEGELQNVERELESLMERTEHIKQIVVMQQSYATVSGMMETVDPRLLVENALRLQQDGLDRHGIEVIRDVADVPSVSVDKHAVLQVLINLVRNAKDAMKLVPIGGRRLTIALRAAESDAIEIAVSDNGVGIPSSNLTKIFSHGFTTKAGGHGFGLHSGALAAKGMGGSLWAHSDGPGKGATFVLRLPAVQAARA